MSDIETPTMAKVIKDAIENRLVDVHTQMPGTIITYDAAKQMASVQPSLQRKYANGKVTSLPIINNVPVHHIRGGKAVIKMPVKSGDPCMIFFAERSLDLWKSKGGQVDPQDTRKHNLSDAFILVGVSSFVDAIAGDATDMVLLNDKAEVRLKSSGKISVKNTTTGDELVDLVKQTEDALVAATVNTIFGPMQLNNFTDFQTLATKVGNIKV